MHVGKRNSFSPLAQVEDTTEKAVVSQVEGCRLLRYKIQLYVNIENMKH